MTVLRIWRTRIDPRRVQEYERFAEQVSMPMFHAQPGCRGVLFTRRGDEAAVLTLWTDRRAADALTGSTSYQRTVLTIHGGSPQLIGSPSGPSRPA